MYEVDLTSAYKPIQVKIKSKVYTAIKLDRAKLRQLEEMERRIKSGHLSLTYEQLEIMLAAKKGEFDTLELRRVNEIIQYVGIANFRAEKESKKTDPKKVIGPGGKS